MLFYTLKPSWESFLAVNLDIHVYVITSEVLIQTPSEGAGLRWVNNSTVPFLTS